MADAQKLEETREFWDQAAKSFDEEPDHGLSDPTIRHAWVGLIKVLLAGPLGRALDLGCGTGSLSLILAELGYEVVGIDLSPKMISLAREKAAQAGREIEFQVMNAADPQLAEGQFSVLVCRHLLWTLPERERVLERWARLLMPGGVLLLVEGFWYTGAGMHVGEAVAVLSPDFQELWVWDLSGEPALWGGPVEDERYAVRAVKHKK